MNTPSKPIKVLTTGAYGLIGNLVYARLASQPEIMTLTGQRGACAHRSAPRGWKKPLKSLPKSCDWPI